MRLATRTLTRRKTRVYASIAGFLVRKQDGGDVGVGLSLALTQSESTAFSRGSTECGTFQMSYLISDRSARKGEPIDRSNGGRRPDLRTLSKPRFGACVDVSGFAIVSTVSTSARRARRAADCSTLTGTPPPTGDCSSPCGTRRSQVRHASSSGTRSATNASKPVIVGTKRLDKSTACFVFSPLTTSLDVGHDTLGNEPYVGFNGGLNSLH